MAEAISLILPFVNFVYYNCEQELNNISLTKENFASIVKEDFFSDLIIITIFTNILTSEQIFTLECCFQNLFLKLDFLQMEETYCKSDDKNELKFFFNWFHGSYLMNNFKN